jgi:hypothetical protein
MSRASAEALIRRKTSSLLNVHAEALRSEIYGTLERSRVGQGVKYRRLPNTSSAPGDSPARQSGRLMESVKVLSRASPDRLVARIGPDPAAFKGAPYPFFLEYGTRKMAPRPYMRPALESFRAAIRGRG